MCLRETSPTLVLLAFLALSPASFAQAPVKIKKWEYAELVAYHTGATGNGENAVRLSVGKSKLEADNWRGLVKKMGITEKEASALVVIDYLGSEGWELTSTMSLAVPPSPAVVELRWYFKRPRE
jgi:hypothetical protein